MSPPPDIVVSDILLLADIHVPLIQLDEPAFADPKRQHRARAENNGLAETHRLLQQAMVETTKPANLPARRGAVRQCTLEPELAAALHEYACSCVVALYLGGQRRSAWLGPHVEGMPADEEGSALAALGNRQGRAVSNTYNHVRAATTSTNGSAKAGLTSARTIFDAPH